MTKTIEDSVHVQNEERQGKEKHLTHAAWMCAAAVFLTFSYANQMVAQTLIQGAAASETTSGNEGDNNNEATQKQSFLEKLNGVEVSYQNASNLVTMNRPMDKSGDEKKIFLLYNVGTKKFLNIGGNWGTHASLSDVPRFFWLQRRNEEKQNGVWAYARYPEKGDATLELCNYVNPLKNFLKLTTSEKTTFQEGSAEGNVRTNAVYKSVVLHRAGILDSDANSENVLKPKVSADGAAFSKSFSGNLSDKVIVADIDLSTCTAGQKENILSIGTDITSTTGNNIHLYYDGTKITVTDGTNTKSVDASGNASIHLHKNGLYINNQLVDGFNASNSIISALVGLAESDKIEVGSKVGDVRSHATYSSLACNTISESVVKADFESNSEKFIKYYPGSLKDYTIETEIDLSKCTGNEKNILSIGTNIAEWGKTGDPSNIHIEYNSEWHSAYIIYGGSRNTGDYVTAWNMYPTGTATIKLNTTDGLTITYKDSYGTTQTQNIPVSNATIQKLLETNELQVGSAVDNRTDVIYKSLNVKKVKQTPDVPDTPTETITNVLDAGTTADGKGFSKEFTGNLSNKTIEANIDLSTCDGDDITILSIGSNIDGSEAKKGEACIHFYYSKSTNSIKYKTTQWLTTEYVSNADGSLGTLPTTSGINNITIKCENGSLTYQFGQWQASSIWINEEITNFLKTSATTIFVGSKAGNPSTAKYNKLTVTETKSSSSNAKPLSPTSRNNSPAVATYAAKSGAEDSETTIYKDVDVNGEKKNETVSDINFSKGDYIEATIDLSKCQNGGLDSKGKQTKLENVFSIGKDITTWGSDLDPTNDGSNTNLHIYYIKKDEANSRHCLYVAFVNKDHSDDLKRIFYVPTTGDNANIMKLKLSKEGLVINDQNIYPDTNPIPTINYTEGLEGEIVRFKMANTDNNIYEVQDGHLIPVKSGEDGYDTAHGMNTSYNGYIYTTESRSDNNGKGEMPFFLTSNFTMNDATNNEGKYFSWAPLLSNVGYSNIGVFADRALPQSDIYQKSQDLAVSTAQWHFECVDETNHIYRIYLNMKNADVPERTAKGTQSTITLGSQTYTLNNYKYVQHSGKFYLQATTQDVFGNDLGNYHTGKIEATGSGSYDGAEAIYAATAPEDATAQWKLVTLEEYMNLFKQSLKELGDETVDITYLLKDPSFSRRNGDLATGWTMDSGLEGKVRIGYDEYYKKSPTDAGYSDDQGYWYRWEDDGAAHYFQNNTEMKGEAATTVSKNLNPLWSRFQDTTNGNHARYMGMDVQGDGVTGKMHQTVQFSNSGWYTIKCGGFTTRNSKLYVTIGGKTIDTPLHKLTKGEYGQVQMTTKAWPFDNDPTVNPAQAMPMYNALVYINDDNLKDTNDNGYEKSGTETQTKTDKKIHEDFNSQSLRFYITPDMLSGGSVSVDFGINVDHSTTNQNDISTQSVSPSAEYDGLSWTVFDNFQVLFGGSVEHRDLVLDEDKTDLDYLDETMQSYRSSTEEGSKQHTALYLHRTFTPGVWNSIMLPVGLTETQFKNAFGEYAQLAELNSLTKHEINFKTVTSSTNFAEKGVDGNDYNESYWLKPLTAYIIKPEKTSGSYKDGTTQELTYWTDKQKNASDGTTKLLTTSVSIAKDVPCYKIEDINLLPLQKFTMTSAEHETEASDYAQAGINYRWNFVGMTENVNTIKDGAFAKSDCPYVMKSQTAEIAKDDDSMTAYGLLAQNVTEGADGTANLIDNRPVLSDSYILQSNQLKYKKNGNPQKAFRCWFEYNAKSSSSEAKPMVLLDGVNMTTGIDNIMDNDEGFSPIDQYKKGIFNLGGQLLSKDSADFDKLPKGIYIVDGKKLTKE